MAWKLERTSMSMPYSRLAMDTTQHISKHFQFARNEVSGSLTSCDMLAELNWLRTQLSGFFPRSDELKHW